jgi:catechol 2,3-dioxygenase-like lactoylglutathione lyase family enzyme
MTEREFPTEDVELTHLLVVRDLEASTRFYRDILGATVFREYGGTSCVLRFQGAWLLLVTGGGPTPDKPTVTFAPPEDPDRVSHELTLRVPDCRRAFAILSERGAPSSPIRWSPFGRSARSSATRTGTCWRSARRRAKRRAGTQALGGKQKCPEVLP